MEGSFFLREQWKDPHPNNSPLLDRPSPSSFLAAMGLQEGTSESAVTRRRVRATTTYYATRTEPPGSCEPEFAVRLQCSVARYAKCVRAAGQNLEYSSAYRGDDAVARFAAADPESIPCDEAQVRAAVRDALRAVRPLRDLGLTDDEWDAAVPADVVPVIADLARGHRSAADGSSCSVSVAMDVELRVTCSARRALMTACKKAEAAAAGDDDDCGVCFEALSEEGKEGFPVELPGCAHAFHRRCISKWFSRKPTCPMCRSDVTKHLDPALQKLLAEFDDPPATTSADALRLPEE
ncbi:hypothetical protein ACP70R_036120 [Stipagrostis hirtigluma subsp. patula]